jgi:hypothetical protein
MTTVGWIFMLVSLSFVWGLIAWCYSRILRLPPEMETAKPARDFHSA